MPSPGTMEMFNSASNVNVHGGEFSNVGRDYNHTVYNNTAVYTNPGPSLTKFLELLPGIDCESKHTTVKSVIRTQPSAGLWLLAHEAYMTWKAGQSSARLLWLNGIPGAGKTVLCSRVIDDLRKSQVPVLYFYCEYDVPTRHDSTNIFASLLHQIILSTPPHSPQLSQTLNRYQLTRDINDLPLTDLILELSKVYEKTFIVIDGLDECSDLECTLMELMILGKDLHVFVSSRENAEVRSRFESYEQIKISIDNIVDDIRSFGKAEVGRIKFQNAKLCDEIVKRLVASAEGSFLWSSYQIQRLRGAKTDSDAEQILATTPPDMQKTVVRALKAIDSRQNSETLRLTLLLVMCAQRPIMLQELAECVGILEMTGSRNQALISMDPRGLVDEFAGLLICVSATETSQYERYWPRGDSSDLLDDNDIVVPVHQYAKDFLLSHLMMLLLPLEKYLLHPSRPIQASIAKLRVASDLIFKRVGSFHPEPADYPFAEYARRLKQRAYDEIRRVLVKTYLINEIETVDWLNNFLNRFWPLSEPSISGTIVMTIDSVLSTNTPAFLDYMRIKMFTLGNKAPRIESARIIPDTEDGVLVMDWTISFKPFDISDATPEQAAGYVDPKVVFSIRIGNGLAGAEIPIQAEDITFKGHIKLQLKLMSNFPHVQVADFSLMRRPKIDFVLKHTGGNTFGSVANIPAISSFIHEMVHSHFGVTMNDVPFLTISLEEILSKQAVDEAIGVIKVTLHSARGLKPPRIGGTRDLYVSLNIDGREEMARTKYKHSTSNPTWMETKFVLVNNLEEYLYLNVYNYNEHRRDTLLGAAVFELGTLLDDAQQESITGRILKDGKEKGEVKYDISYYPVLTTEESDGRRPDTNVGIVRLIIHQATGLNSRSMSGELNPAVKVYLGDEKAAVYKGPVNRNTNSPIWDAAYEFLCLDKLSSKIGIRVIDDRESLKVSEIGYMVIRLADLLTCSNEAGKEWFDLSDCNYGKIRVSAKWNALNLDDALVGAKQYTTPIGVVRLLLDQGNDVKNLRAALVGKSDLYARVLVNNIIKGRTDIITNDHYPAWDPIIYIPVHSLKETFQLECVDYQHSTEDRPLGSVKINVSELAKASDNSRYRFESTGVQKRTDRTIIERDNYKGALHYSAEFVPAMHIKGSSFKPRQNELQTISSGIDLDARSFTSGSSFASSFEDDNWLTNVTIHMSNENVNISASTQSDSKNTDIALTSEENEGVEMDVDELLTHQSGIILFNVLSGQLNRKARLEVLLNDGYWPCFSTTKARSTQPQWDYIGEGFMGELNSGLVCLRLNEGDDCNKDEIIGIWKQEAKSFLEKALIAPHSFTLYDPKNDKKAVAHVIVEARYIPVPVKLEPRESISNQGVLRVLLISGHDLRAADRSGNSDPFVVFTLNGHQVIRSQVRKKTLDPEWGEEFETAIESRIHAEFSLEVFNWNQIKQSESLGTGPIDLLNLKPFIATDQVITLSSPKHGKKGQIRLNLLFTPKFILKSKKNTSTFTSAVRTMTQMGAFVGLRRA